MRFAFLAPDQQAYAGWLYAYHRARFDTLRREGCSTSDMPLGLALDAGDNALAHYLIAVSGDPDKPTFYAGLRVTPDCPVRQEVAEAGGPRILDSDVHEISGLAFNPSLSATDCRETALTLIETALGQTLRTADRIVVRIPRSFAFDSPFSDLGDTRWRPIEDDYGRAVMETRLAVSEEARTRAFSMPAPRNSDLPESASRYRPDHTRTVQTFLVLMTGEDRSDFYATLHRIGMGTESEADRQMFDLMHREAHQMAAQHWARRRSS